jgi:hypothetical protein
MTYQPAQQNQTGAFGEQIVAQKEPILQMSNKYEIDPALATDHLEVFSATGGSVDSAANMFRCQSGTSVGGYGVIRSKEAINYRAGQGIDCQFTAAFTTGIATSLQFGGMFNLTETIAFGYNGTSFSALHSYGGAAEIQTIQITAAATVAANCTVTLDGDALAIALTIASVQTNARTIVTALRADATIGAKWNFEQVNDTVYCIAKNVGNLTGTMSYAAGTTGSTATVAEVIAGAAKTDNHTAQASFNLAAPFSGFDPTMLNVYKIKYGYLGAANITYSIYNPTTGLFQDVHQIQWANSATTPHTGSPDFKIGWTAASLGSSGTNLIVTGSSASLMIEGAAVNRDDTHALDNEKLLVTATLTNIITIKNRLTFGKRYNLGKLLPLRLSFDNDHNKGAVIEIVKNATIGGTINYQFHDQWNSIVAYDTAGTTVTGGDLVDAFALSAASADNIDLLQLELYLLPGETLTIAAKTVSGTSTGMTATLTWKEIK